MDTSICQKGDLIMKQYETVMSHLIDSFSIVSMIAGAIGCVTSPIPRRMDFLLRVLCLNADTLFCDICEEIAARQLGKIFIDFKHVSNPLL